MYDRRPSVWVEPKGKWGKGAIHLVEIPTDDEIHDNIVAMGCPTKKTGPGKEVNLSYKLYWKADEPFRRNSGGAWRRGSATAASRACRARAAYASSWWNFSAVRSRNCRRACAPSPISRPRAARSPMSSPTPCPTTCRATGAQFDLTVEGDDPVEMRLVLKNGEEVLTETWMFQYHPFDSWPPQKKWGCRPFSRVCAVVAAAPRWNYAACAACAPPRSGEHIVLSALPSNVEVVVVGAGAAGVAAARRLMSAGRDSRDRGARPDRRSRAYD